MTPPQKKRTERLQIIIFSLSFFIAGVIVYLMPGNQQLSELLLFIPAALILIVSANQVIAPKTTQMILKKTITKQQSVYSIVAAIVFVLLIPANELFILWSVAFEYIYYDCFPIVLGLASTTILIGTIRLQINDQSYKTTFSESGIMLIWFALFFTGFYLSATNFSFVTWWAFIINAICLFYCTQIVFKVGLALFISTLQKERGFTTWKMRIMVWIISLLCIFGAIFGALDSRGVGVGISLFESIWFGFVAISIIIVFHPLKFEEIRIANKAFLAFLFFLILIQGAIYVCIWAAAHNNFGYIAKNSLFMVYALPVLLFFLFIVGGLRVMLKVLLANRAGDKKH